MAKQRRRRKHKGTQAGTVRKRRAAPRAQARATAEHRRADRLAQPPTWRSSITRGLIAGVALLALLAIVGGSIGEAVILALAALLVYIPAFHMIDSVLYRRRQRRGAQESQDAQRRPPD